jgi:hypothetical protein
MSIDMFSFVVPCSLLELQYYTFEIKITITIKLKLKFKLEH